MDRAARPTDEHIQTIINLVLCMAAIAVVLATALAIAADPATLLSRLAGR
jgi:hypothetical protein